MNIRKIIRTIKYATPRKTEYFCNYCNKNVEFMTENTGSEDTWASKEFHVIGAGFRDNNTCPICYSTDRQRFLNYYYQNHTDIFQSKDKTVLHFSPEKPLKEKLLKVIREDLYYNCNIEQSKEKYTVDITNLTFKNDFFDFIICSYVLEHVKDDNIALCELHRVLKYNGSVLVTFPITLLSNTIEGTGIENAQERKKLFCQEDHVRLYGMDVIEKFYNAGFDVEVFTLSEEQQKKLYSSRFIHGERLFILRKKKGY